MSYLRYSKWFFALVLVACSTTAMAAEWGNLTGQFIYDGTPPAKKKVAVTKDVEVCGKHPLYDETLVVGEKGEIANVVIWALTKNLAVNPEYEATAKDRVKFDNHMCRFTPHILLMRMTQTLVLHNSDAVAHNTNLTPILNPAFNQSLASMNEAEYKFARMERVPVKVVCNVHPWMNGYILARDNPYMAVSGEDGKFKIANLPVGEIEFQAWQELSGYVAIPGWDKGRFKVKIKAGDNDLRVIKISPKLFEKK